MFFLRVCCFNNVQRNTNFKYIPNISVLLKDLVSTALGTLLGKVRAIKNVLFSRLPSFQNSEWIYSFLREQLVKF